MNQLDATMIYWSIRSAQHVSGNILPIIRSVSLRYLQHMVSCCCGGQGDGERQRCTMCTVRREILDLFLQVVCRQDRLTTEFSSLWGLILYQMSNVFVIIKMCYVHNQWYDISCATLCIKNWLEPILPVFITWLVHKLKFLMATVHFATHCYYRSYTYDPIRLFPLNFKYNASLIIPVMSVYSFTWSNHCSCSFPITKNIKDIR